MKKISINNTFAKSVVSLASGTALSQIITILCSPILTRLFPPQEFGVMSLFVSITTFVATISMLRYEAAIVLPKSDASAIKILSLCIVLLIVTTSISIVVFPAASIFFPNSTLVNKLNGWIYLIPIFIFIQSLRLVAVSWNTRKKQFKVVSCSNIIRSSLTNFSKIVVGKFSIISSGGLIFGVVFGQLSETLYLVIRNFRAFVLSIRSIKYASLKSTFHKHIDFFTKNTPHVLVDSLRNYISPIVIAYFFSEQILGYYSLMFSIVMLPVTFLGSAMSQVYYSNLASRFAHKEDVFGMTQKMLLYNSLLPLVPSLIIFIFGKQIFSFVFGVEWAQAGEFASSLSLYMYIYYISICFSYIPYVIRKLKMAFYYGVIINTIFFLIIILGSILNWEFINILRTINIVVSVLFIIYIIQMIVELRRANVSNLDYH